MSSKNVILPVGHRHFSLKSFFLCVYSQVTRWVPKVTDMKAISKVLDMEEDMQDEERKIRFEDPEHSVTSDDAPRDVFRCFTCSICGYKCFKKRLRHSHQKR